MRLIYMYYVYMYILFTCTLLVPKLVSVLYTVFFSVALTIGPAIVYQPKYQYWLSAML